MAGSNESYTDIGYGVEKIGTPTVRTTKLVAALAIQNNTRILIIYSRSLFDFMLLAKSLLEVRPFD